MMRLALLPRSSSSRTNSNSNLNSNRRKTFKKTKSAKLRRRPSSFWGSWVGSCECPTKWGQGSPRGCAPKKSHPQTTTGNMELSSHSGVTAAEETRYCTHHRSQMGQWEVARTHTTQVMRKCLPGCLCGDSNREKLKRQLCKVKAVSLSSSSSIKHQKMIIVPLICILIHLTLLMQIY